LANKLICQAQSTGSLCLNPPALKKNKNIKTRKKAIVEYLDYQIPVIS